MCVYLQSAGPVRDLYRFLNATIGFLMNLLSFHLMVFLKQLLLVVTAVSSSSVYITLRPFCEFYDHEAEVKVQIYYTHMYINTEQRAADYMPSTFSIYCGMGVFP